MPFSNPKGPPLSKWLPFPYSLSTFYIYSVMAWHYQGTLVVTTAVKLSMGFHTSWLLYKVLPVSQMLFILPQI